MSIRRVGGLLCAVGLLAAALAWVGPVAGQAGPRTVRVAIKGSENNITPFTVGFLANPATNDIQHLVYDSLFWSQAKADPEPWLAEKAESSDGGKVWTVTLRTGVTWQDGKAFTADDVAFSYDYYKKFPGASGRYAHHVNDTPAYDRAEVVDDRTVKLFFSAAAPQFKIMPGADLPILARHVFEGIADPAKNTTSLPIGTGPFKLTEIVPDQRYKLEANQQYFKGKPRIDRLEMVIIKDPVAAAQMLDDAGYSAKDADGVRQTADGKRLEFSVLVNSFEPLEIRATQLIATQMQGLGVKYNVESLDPATLRSRRNPVAGQPIPSYDAYVGNIESHAHVDPDALYYFFHSPGKGPNGKEQGFGGSITGYTNPEFDKLVEQARTADASERRSLLADAQALLARDIPQQVLWYSDGIWAYRQAAYDGWVNDRGQGIFTKRSFLPGYEDIALNKPGGTAAGARTAKNDAGSSTSVFLIGGAVLAGLVVVGVVVSRRRKVTEDE